VLSDQEASLVAQGVVPTDVIVHSLQAQAVLLPHLHWHWARACQICSGTGLTPARICAGNGLTRPHLHRHWAHRCVHLHWDAAAVLFGHRCCCRSSSRL
jgi:hypothetical protein